MQNQWTTPEAPEFHEVMDKVKAAGFKTIAGCPSADAADTSLSGTLKSLQLYLKKINERPDKYQIVRTVKDIDAAVASSALIGSSWAWACSPIWRPTSVVTPNAAAFPMATASLPIKPE